MYQPPYHTPTPSAQYHAFAPPPQRPRKTLWLALAVLITLCGAAVTTLVVLFSGNDTTPKTEASEEPKERVDVDEPNTELKTDPAETLTAKDRKTTVKVVVDTMPSGAEVYRGDELIGTSPLTLEMDPENERAALTLVKDGHAVTSYDLDVSMSGSYIVELEALSTAEATENPAPKAKTQKTTRKPKKDRGRTKIERKVRPTQFIPE